MLTFNFTPYPTLHTPRLILREVTHADNPQLLYLRTHPEVMQYIDRPINDTPESITKFIDMLVNNRIKNEGISWSICLKEDNVMIGDVAFWRLQPEHHRAEIGYMLHPSFQRKGIMKEAIQAVLQYGFETMKLHSVEANTNPLNQASQHLLQSLGFQQEAYFKENFFYDGKFLDSAIFSLISPIPYQAQ